MPEQPPSNRPKVLPFQRAEAKPRRARPAPGAGAAPAYAELLAASNFSFLRGASHPEELSAAAAFLGLSGLAVTDRNSLAGVVRGHLAAKETGVPFAVGCRLVFVDDTPEMAAWAPDRAAYGRLCRLLTQGNLRSGKGDPQIVRADLLEWGEGLEFALLPGARPGPGLMPFARELIESFPGRVRLGATCLHDGNDRRRIAEFQALVRRLGVPLLALGDALYHAPERRPLQDVLTCIREHVTLDTAGRLLQPNAERHLKSPAEMARLFADAPEAVAETMRLMEQPQFSLDELRYEYPQEPAGESATPFDELARLAWEGAAQRYPAGVPDKVKSAIDHELKLIAELDYAPYFLTVWDIVRFARSRGILCQGRGSAANSAVCFALGITEVDPERSDLLFERFVSPERREPPDIDVDFEHERREEVIQYLYDKYGRDRAGIAATIITYRSRSATREVGKAFGLSDDAVSALAGNIWGWSKEAVAQDDARRAGLDPAEPRVSKMLALSRQIIGFPRHLSQHVGGFVITRGRLDELVPVGPSAMEGRTIIEWDKDDLDALGMLKVDVLALGMLSCLRRALDMLARQYGRPLTLAAIPPEDPETYDMICRADTVGVFQIESRAQMTMLPRLRPRTFYDLVIEVAIVRPGPIQGDMVHPYLRRRQGLEEASYPAPAPEHGPADELQQVLGKTLGVPLFQEQAMRIAIVAAHFTPAEADKLRRAMATFRRVGTISTFRKKMIDGMVARGYDSGFAERCFHQIEGFGEYGFPESHAASFALLVYASAWVKCHYPDVFCAALLNAQPMGFYAPAQIVRDAREHGVEVREVDVNRSDWDATLEALESPPPLRGRESAHLHPRHSEQAAAIWTHYAVRLGLRQIKGLREADAARLAAARGRPYASVRDLWLRAGIGRPALEKLAEADAFRSIGLDRRQALWQVRALDDSQAPLPLFEEGEAFHSCHPGLAEGQDRDLLTPSDREEAALLQPSGGHGSRKRRSRAASGMTMMEEDAAPWHAEPAVELPEMPLGEHVVSDYRALTLSLKAHPLALLRPHLDRCGIVKAEALGEPLNGRRVRVAGLTLVRQRPGSASGVVFATIEDETGVANVIVWPKVFERYRPVVMGARLLAVAGRLQAESGVIHVVAERLEDFTPLMAHLAETSAPFTALAPTDEVRRPVDDTHELVRKRHRLARLLKSDPALAEDLRALALQAAVLPKGRNFR